MKVVVSDGTGGWYIGGSFTKVGGLSRHNLAYSHSDKSVDPAWNPAPDGPVYALLLSSSTLYVGGYFANIGGYARNNIAAVNIGTGNADGLTISVVNLADVLRPSALQAPVRQLPGTPTPMAPSTLSWCPKAPFTPVVLSLLSAVTRDPI